MKCFVVLSLLSVAMALEYVPVHKHVEQEQKGISPIIDQNGPDGPEFWKVDDNGNRNLHLDGIQRLNYNREGSRKYMRRMRMGPFVSTMGQQYPGDSKNVDHLQIRFPDYADFVRPTSIKSMGYMDMSGVKSFGFEDPVHVQMDSAKDKYRYDVGDVEHLKLDGSDNGFSYRVPSDAGGVVPRIRGGGKVSWRVGDKQNLEDWAPVAADQFVKNTGNGICYCPLAPPICASNYRTYPGECYMHYCSGEPFPLYKLYDGPCGMRNKDSVALPGAKVHKV